MKIKVLLCNCKGLCPSFKNTDMNTLPFLVESELDVDYAIVHPQLCGQGGNEIVADVMREGAGDVNTHIVGGACAPEAQLRLFRKVIRKTGFDEARFAPVDIRGTNNEGILSRLQETLDSIARREEDKAHPQAA